MSRPITLFSGHWADLTLEGLAKIVSAWGFDGPVLACWGDHFEVDKALESDKHIQSRWEILNKDIHKYYAISSHLVGQCVADDPIDERHRAVFPYRLWSDADPDGVLARAQQEMKDTAFAAKKIGLEEIDGFTGSPVWKNLYFFPPTTQGMIARGYEFLAEMWPLMARLSKMDAVLL